MRGDVQRSALELVHQILGGTIERTTPEWLIRPGLIECGRFWSLIREIYRELTPDQELPETMRESEWRKVDCVLRVAQSPPRIIEVDEAQHFNRYRAATLRRYPSDLQLAFDRTVWIERSKAKTKLEGGGFAKPKPPLFPGSEGRHRQRAFRDALCDILPLEHGFSPTLRIADFEVESWLTRDDARNKMKELLDRKLSN